MFSVTLLFLDFDNELDDLLKHAIEEDRSKTASKRSQPAEVITTSASPNTTSFKQKPIISLFDDDKPVSKRCNGFYELGDVVTNQLPLWNCLLNYVRTQSACRSRLRSTYYLLYRDIIYFTGILE